jgi:hypothetical protein
MFCSEHIKSFHLENSFIILKHRDLEVSTKYAYILLWAKLLKPLAGRSLVTGQMVYGANGLSALKEEMRATLSCGFADHRLEVFVIERTI